MESLLSVGGGMRVGFNLCGAMAWALLAFSAPAREVSAAGQVRPVPLSGSLDRQIGDGSYGVYVPTRHGGILTIRWSRARSRR
jgi:hypothetical protein